VTATTATPTAGGDSALFVLIDAEVRRLLNAVVKRGERIGPAMDAIGFSLTNRIALCFAAQQSPWGEPWAPLDKKTLKRRRDQGRDGVSILRDTGELLGTLSYTAGYAGVDIRIGTTNRPALPHQFGTKHLPARPMLPVRDNDQVDLPAPWRAEVLAVLNAHLTQDVP
jgi:phage virion morphogenesis protein